MSMQAAIQQVAEVAGVPPPRFEIPLRLLDILVAIDDALPGINLTGNHLRAVRQWQYYDNTKAVSAFNWRPRPFAQTVQDALDWFRTNSYL